MNLLDSMHLYVIPSVKTLATHVPGFPAKCKKPGCPHTWDWRFKPGSPENSHRVRPKLERVPLRDVFERQFHGSWLCACYELSYLGVPVDPQPRIAKDALGWLRAEGFEVHMKALIADWDTPDHVPWTPELRAEFDALWARCKGPFATCGVYLSPKGVRLVQPLERPLVPEEGEPILRRWLDELVDAGADPSVRDAKDWTRLMRVANYTRPEVTE